MIDHKSEEQAEIIHQVVSAIAKQLKEPIHFYFGFDEAGRRSDPKLKLKNATREFTFFSNNSITPTKPIIKPWLGEYDGDASLICEWGCENSIDISTLDAAIVPEFEDRSYDKWGYENLIDNIPEFLITQNHTATNSWEENLILSEMLEKNIKELIPEKFYNFILSNAAFKDESIFKSLINYSGRELIREFTNFVYEQKIREKDQDELDFIIFAITLNHKNANFKEFLDKIKLI